MSRMIPLAMFGICFCLLPAVPLLAASMTIDGDSPRESVTLTVEDAPVDMVLESLRTKYGFEIGGLENANQAGDTLSITLSGSLYNIIERLLRNRNHVIVRSPDNVSGIEKVMILDAAYGAGPPKASARGTGGNVPGKQLQAYSSEKSAAPAMTGRHNQPD